MTSVNHVVSVPPQITQLIQEIYETVEAKLHNSTDNSTKQKDNRSTTPPDYFTQMVTTYLDFTDEMQHDQNPPKNVTFEVTAAEMLKEVKELRTILEEMEAERERASFYLEFATKMGLVYVGWRLLTRRW